MKTLSVIIVSYNTVELLRKCLENLENSYEPLEVIVIDNASTDGSAQLVADDFPWVHLINSENLGISHAHNLGLNHSKGDYLLFLGTDAYPTEVVLRELITYMEENPQVGVAVPKLLLASGSQDMDAHRGFPTPWVALTHILKLNKLFPKSKVFNGYFMGDQDLTTPHEIDLGISHFMFVKRQAQQEIGAWDEDFHVFGEDVDFCYRIKQAGWKIMYLPQWQVTHLGGGGIPRDSHGGTRGAGVETASSKSRETQVKMARERGRAQRLFYKKHFEQLYPALVNKLVYFGIGLAEKRRLAKVNSGKV